MTAAATMLVVIWIGLSMYALLGGADFGAGFWDLVAGGARRGRRHRALIEQVIGPVWEANHVWLIFVLVLLWTGFPPAFAAMMSTLYIPLTLAAIGIIARGAAFAFRKASTRLWQQRLFGATFALSSVLTPYFLGAAAGGIASGRVPAGLARGDLVTSWVNPTSVVGGLLAVGLCAYLAACYLCHDAQRLGDADLAAGYRRRALATGIAVGALSMVGLLVVRADVPRLYSQLTGRALPLVGVAMAAGTGSLLLLAARRLLAVRAGAALAVTAVLWGWGVAQYPRMLGRDIPYAAVAATGTVLRATLLVTAIGALVLLPSLALLITLFQRGTAPVPGQPRSRG